MDGVDEDQAGLAVQCAFGNDLFDPSAGPVAGPGVDERPRALGFGAEVACQRVEESLR
jgi:hypothetical protein